MHLDMLEHFSCFRIQSKLLGNVGHLSVTLQISFGRKLLRDTLVSPFAVNKIRFCSSEDAIIPTMASAGFNIRVVFLYGTRIFDEKRVPCGP